MMTHKYKSIQIQSQLNSGEIEIRPLSFDEVHEVLLFARNSGWYGNNEILNFLVVTGSLNEGEKIDPNKIESFIRSMIAREVWIATLKSLSKHVNNLISLIKEIDGENFQLNKIKIKPYKFKDLSNPGLFWSIQKDINHMNVEEFTKGLVNFMIVKVDTGKEKLSGKVKEQYLEKRWEQISEWLLKQNHIDDGFDIDLLKNIFHSQSERFYAILSVSETIDWKQYFKIVFHLNKCTENLNLKSNKLGGLDISKPVLVTGVPGFYELLFHSNNVPLEIIVHLLNDLVTKKKLILSKHYARLIKKFYNEATLKVASNINQMEKKDKFEIAFDLMNCFASKINKNKKLINILCYIYWDNFKESIEKHIDKNYQKFIEDCSLTNIPDCYLLVEGICETIFFNQILRLYNNKKVYIKVINCKSKHGVYSKYRDVLHNEPYIGCIVTVLDSDAQKEHNMIKKLKQKSLYTEHFILEKGTFEDLFPLKLHVKILNNLFQNGIEINLSDFIKNNPVEKQLKRIVWEKKKSNFDKASYAKAISKEITSHQKIPHFARLIVDRAIELSMTKLKNKPKTYSLYSIDELAKKIEFNDY